MGEQKCHRGTKRVTEKKFDLLRLELWGQALLATRASGEMGGKRTAAADGLKDRSLSLVFGPTVRRTFIRGPKCIEPDDEDGLL